ADAAGPRAAATVLAVLVAKFVEIAGPGQRFTDVTDFVLPHAAAAGQQGCAKRAQVVRPRGGEADPGNDDSQGVWKRGNHAATSEADHGTYRPETPLTRQRSLQTAEDIRAPLPV